MEVRDARWAAGLARGEVGAGEEVVGWLAGGEEFEPGGVVLVGWKGLGGVREGGVPGVAAGWRVAEAGCAHLWLRAKLWLFAGGVRERRLRLV